MGRPAKMTANDRKKAAEIARIAYLENIQYEFVINSVGTEIKKCCASCAFKVPHDTEGDHRGCIHTLGEKKIVNKKDCCSSWRIADWADVVKTNCSIPPEVRKELNMESQ